MRRIGKQKAEEGAEIDLTPMLDVVFIMLIFFIVVASFLKEAGVEVTRPDNNQPDDPNDAVSIVFEVAADGQIYLENRRVDERAGMLDAAGFGSALTDLRVYEQKVSRIVGAEKERAQLERILAAKRALLGE